MHGTAATQAGSGLPRQADAAIALLVVVSLQPQPPNPGGVGAWVVVAGSSSPRGFFSLLLASCFFEQFAASREGAKSRPGAWRLCSIAIFLHMACFLCSVCLAPFF